MAPTDPRRDDLSMRAWAALKGATWAVFARMKENAPGSGASPGHMGFLHALAQAGGALKPGDLAGSLGVTPATVTGAVTALEELGLVERTRSAEDRRVVHVAITARGREVQRRWVETVHEGVRDILAPLSEAELATITRILTRVAPPILGPPRDLLSEIRHDPRTVGGKGSSKRARRRRRS